MRTGKVFNIQKYSIHDGPGIRTTIFFKGCPLKCWWCHNPESIDCNEGVIHLKNKCIKCGDCIDICPNKALAFKDDDIAIDRNKCDLCGKCVDICPTEAMELVGDNMTVSEIIEEIKKDIIFYDESAGGVTFSGGEPLMQHEFLNELLKRCKELEIHTTLDTSGYASWDVLSPISKNIDLFLYDIKHMDDEKHKKYVGVSNKKILDNLKKLSSNNKEIWIRIPIIPSINDDNENINKTGEFIKSLGLRDVCILPYHDIAVDKYARLDKEYKLNDIQAPSNEHMNNIAKKLEKFGLKIKIGG